MAKPLKLIIFDCDGTLVDSQHIIVAAMTRAYAFHGLSPPERAVLLSVVGLSIVEAFTKLGNGAAGFPASGLAEQYRLASRAIRESGQEIEPLYPGAADAIAELARRDEIVLGIATGKSQRGVRLVLGITVCSTASSRSRRPMTRRQSPILGWCSQRCATPALLRRTRS